MKSTLFMRCTLLLVFLGQNIKAQTPLQISAGADQIICYGSYLNLTAYVAGGVPPYIFKWLPNEALSTIGEASVIAAPTFTTTYKVIVSDTKGNKASDEITVTVAQRPTIVTETYTNLEVNGKVKLNVKVKGNGNLTYTWKPATGLDNPNTCCPIASPNCSTTYTIMVKDANSCIATEQILVNANTSILVNSEKK